MSIYNIISDQEEVVKHKFNLKFDDPSLNGQNLPALKTSIPLTFQQIKKQFLRKIELDYVVDYCIANDTPARIVTFPSSTNTCFEKALELDNWNPLNVIKALYLKDTGSDDLYAVIVPETGCFLDKGYVRKLLALPSEVALVKATKLPKYMTYGTCSPLVRSEDLIGKGGNIKKIYFDTETLEMKKKENTLDDFSFGGDHRHAFQMNYSSCYTMLKSIFPDHVESKQVLSLSFCEKLYRKKGRIKINYEFNSMDYKTARFINDIHGFGDVSIYNDYVDELFIANMLNVGRKKKVLQYM